jgi:hypothetical protein
LIHRNSTDVVVLQNILVLGRVEFLWGGEVDGDWIPLMVAIEASGRRTNDEETSILAESTPRSKDEEVKELKMKLLDIAQSGKDSLSR